MVNKPSLMEDLLLNNFITKWLYITIQELEVNNYSQNTYRVEFYIVIARRLQYTVTFSIFSERNPKVIIHQFS